MTIILDPSKVTEMATAIVYLGLSLAVFGFGFAFLLAGLRAAWKDWTK